MTAPLKAIDGNADLPALMTDLAARARIAARVLAQGAPAANDYLGFLKAGGSVYPLEALQRAGVDLSGPEPVEAAFATMAGYVDRLEALLEV